MFEKILVANRGEIAVRVIQACKELDIPALAVYSDADKDAKHVRLADEAAHLGSNAPKESYLNQSALIQVARDRGADGVHPGYGFLSESPTFAATVEDAGLVWIGPSSSAMELLGEKTMARSTMVEAGIPIIPGTLKPISTADEVRAFAEEKEYPVAIKAAGGGGGRGLEVIENAKDVEKGFRDAVQAGEAYFNNPAVYVEKFFENPKHIEVQILADEFGTVRHFGERECSVQRRQQKLIEETPAPTLDGPTRSEICAAAVDGMAKAGYTNAGTVEFLFQDGRFYFLEVNTRIQVENTISEAVTGKDIVKWQIRVAAGEQLNFRQDEVSIDGVAMEFRLNAEDPRADFRPFPGRVERFIPPSGIGIRHDTGVDPGDKISPYYDSLLSKLIITGENRTEVIARAARALDEFVVEGVPTTLPFYEEILHADQFQEGAYGTNFVEDFRYNSTEPVKGN